MNGHDLIWKGGLSLASETPMLLIYFHSLILYSFSNKDAKRHPNTYCQIKKNKVILSII